jgi:hypothetical protein
LDKKKIIYIFQLKKKINEMADKLNGLYKDLFNENNTRDPNDPIIFYINKLKTELEEESSVIEASLSEDDDYSSSSSSMNDHYYKIEEHQQ